VLQSGDWWVGVSNGTSFTNQFWTHWYAGVTWADVRVGNFSGHANGMDDIAGRVLQSGDWWVGVSNGTSFTNQFWTHWYAGVTWVDVLAGNFSGHPNGTDDIAGRVLQSGDWWVAQSSGSSFTNSLWTIWDPNVSWVDVKVGDFNGDGKADIIGRVASSGDWWVAKSTGSSFTNSFWAHWYSGATWVDVQVGDFNGDGSADIAGRNLADGAWWVGLSNGSTAFNTTLWDFWSTGVTWVDVHSGDFA
jgi:hypothetical protein